MASDIPSPTDKQSADNGGSADANSATDLIRQKVARLYQEEPDVRQELTEAQAQTTTYRSKHQQFMFELSSSGKDLATIQTEWHNYYQNLPANQKHEVWQEFYDSQPAVTDATVSPANDAQKLSQHKRQAARPVKTKSPAKQGRTRNAKQVQAAIRDKVTAGGKLEAKHHLQSLLFGLGMGLIVLIIFLFGFFNEVIIAPFIQPGRTSAATPLIVSSTSVAPSQNPEVIIPKINVEIPVNYTGTSIDENAIENDLENGVVHYPTTAVPGQNGNAAYFGHSSNNIFNKGKYKFAFVLLHTLVPGDTFYLTYSGKVYAYKVISKKVVEPSEVSVLNPIEGQTATATLITCDPPGTSLHRLVVVGEQISPAPADNTASTQTPAAITSSVSLPGNGPTLWGKLAHSITGKVIIFAAVAVCLGLAYRFIRQQSRPARAA